MIKLLKEYHLTEEESTWIVRRCTESVSRIFETFAIYGDLSSANTFGHWLHLPEETICCCDLLNSGTMNNISYDRIFNGTLSEMKTILTILNLLWSS